MTPRKQYGGLVNEMAKHVATVPACLELFATSSVRPPRLKIDACAFTDAKQRNIDGTRAFVGLAEIVLVL
ncbi:MAG: hypothetical protein ABJN75_15930 [Hoeflea sp.]|uniref:hypothetical protein n=1 Tax=Hoeflea sp. TaxID=1940281 RepID=UPI0032990E2B|tara:strand:+ start:13607 stop:13816 length:210 start_codon:yes stop_codon:yes gene_type:complete